MKIIYSKSIKVNILDEPNWGEIDLVDNEQKIITLHGDVIKLVDWLKLNKLNILTEHFFYGNSSDSLSKRLDGARNVEFFSTEGYQNSIFDYWHDKIFKYFKCHSFVFGLRGDVNIPYIIGLNNGQGEISHYDSDEGIDFKYQFNLLEFFKNIEKDFS